MGDGRSDDGGRGRRTAAKRKKGKFKMRGFLQSDVGAEGETELKAGVGCPPGKISVAGYYSQIMVPPI